MGIELDPLIHSPNRLQLCAMLMPVNAVDFQYLREKLAVSESVLSKQIKLLVDAGYATQKKTYDYKGKTKSTWVSITNKGRKAFKRHVKALQQITMMAKGE